MHTNKMWMDASMWILSPLKIKENSHLKNIFVFMFTKCDSEEKQLQHLNHISRSHVDYYIGLLMNHPLYLLHWVVLLISFISCPWFFFLFSMSCFSSCRFHQTVSNKEGQGSFAWTPLKALNGLRVSHARDIHLLCQFILKYFPGYYSLQKGICDLVAQ